MKYIIIVHVFVMVGTLLPPIPCGSFSTSNLLVNKRKIRIMIVLIFKLENVLNFQLLFSLLGTIYLIFFWVIS